MKVTTEKLEKSRVALQVEVEPEMVERSMERAYRRIVNRANIPGFRRGKAPRFMVERVVGKAALLEEALEILVPDAYKQAVEEQNISALGQPQIEILQIEPAVSFKATVAVQPTVELGDYSQLSISSETPEVTEEQVAQALEELRSRYAPWEPVDRPVSFDDLVTIDIQGESEGRPFLNQNAAPYLVMKDWSVPLPGFPEQLLDMNKSDTREFVLMFPDDYPDKNRIGKSVNFKVTLSEIKEKQLPVLDDEFAKSVGTGFDSLEALKERVTQDLKSNVEREARGALENQVLDAVVGIARLEYPDILVDHEIEHLVQDDRSVPRDPQGRIDDYLRAIGQSAEEFSEHYREEATRRVVRSLVLGKVSEQEQVAVSPEEIDAEVDRLVENSGEQQEALRSFFNNEQSRASIERILNRQKTMDRLIELTNGVKKAQASAEPAVASSEEGSAEATPAPKGRARRKAGRQGQSAT